MWYEILPAAGVIFGAMYVAWSGPTIVTWLGIDRPSGLRRLFHGYEQAYYLRDRNLTGSVYKLQGLEGIPDEDGATAGAGADKTKK